MTLVEKINEAIYTMRIALYGEPTPEEKFYSKMKTVESALVAFFMGFFSVLLIIPISIIRGFIRASRVLLGYE